METTPLAHSDEDLRRIIRDSGESDYVDAKGPIGWTTDEEKGRLAKDVAAFANSRDGGFLVIGKRETEPGRFELTGLDDQQIVSFETTKVSQWINERFSPPVRLVCRRVEDDGKTFAVIQVSEFHDIPVICTKRCDDAGNKRQPLLEVGRIYIRGANAESKPLQTEAELRELILIATKKRRDEFIQHLDAMLRGRSLVEKVTDQDHFSKELETIRSDLRSRKYYSDESGWEILFHPASYQKERWAESADIERLVRDDSIRRPEAFPDQRTGTFRTGWGIANGTYWETWAFSRSGIFYFNKPFEEDEEGVLDRIRTHVKGNIRHSDAYKARQFTQELETYKWTEYEKNMITIVKNFAFMRRCVDLFGPGEMIHYEYRVRGMQNRHLFAFAPRLSLSFEPMYRDPCGAPSLSIEKTAVASSCCRSLH